MFAQCTYCEVSLQAILRSIDAIFGIVDIRIPVWLTPKFWSDQILVVPELGQHLQTEIFGGWK